MFKTNLSLLALAFVIAVSSAQMTTYYTTSNGVPVDTSVYDQGYTVHKEVTTYTDTGPQGVPINYVHNYNQVRGQGQNGNGWNGNNGGSGNGGGSGGGIFGGKSGGGIFGLASDLFKTTLATGAGLLGGAAGAVLGGTKGAALLANTGADMVNRAT